MEVLLHFIKIEKFQLNWSWLVLHKLTKVSFQDFTTQLQPIAEPNRRHSISIINLSRYQRVWSHWGESFIHVIKPGGLIRRWSSLAVKSWQRLKAARRDVPRSCDPAITFFGYYGGSLGSGGGGGRIVWNGIAWYSRWLTSRGVNFLGFFTFIDRFQASIEILKRLFIEFMMFFGTLH